MRGQELTIRLTVGKSSNREDRGIKKKNCPKVRNYLSQHSHAVLLSVPRTLSYSMEAKSKLADTPQSEDILLLKKHLQSYSTDCVLPTSPL